ncbi:retrovirus-related pol polyprotein from transposon TNT 1-94 [Tanacetum coccineum]
MEEEMDSLRKNKTWELVNPPTGQKLVSSKWLFKIKEGIEGVQKPRYKARLVARGFTQREGIDYNEEFSSPMGYEQGNKSKAEIGSIKSLLKKEFDMKELGEAKKILGMEITTGKSVQMSLSGHFKLSLKDCPVRDCDVERERVRAICKCGWELNVLDGVHEARHSVCDYAKDPDKGRSITGYAFLVQGCVVSWKTTLQHVVALSTTEAEYMALTEAVKEAIWLRGLLEELGVKLNTVAVLEAKTDKVLKVGTEHNAADDLTNTSLLGVDACRCRLI